jgi:hypothetical protein
MAAFKDKKNGSWYVQFRYTDWRGERQQKLKRGFATKKEAQAWEREFLMQKQADVNMSFESFVALYEKDVKPKLKLNTWLSKGHIIRTKILPYFKKRKLSEITARDVIDWQNEIRQHTKSSGESYSPDYLKNVHTQLSCIFNHAIKYYGLQINPAAKAGNMGSEQPKEMLFWTKEEYLKFIDAMMDKPMLYYAFEILYWCGMNKTDYPQVFGSNLALYTETNYMAICGKVPAFREVDRKITQLAERAYRKQKKAANAYRHRAIVWGVQSHFYMDFLVWLLNCWGIVPLTDMLSMVSTRELVTEDTPENREQAYYDMAWLTENMIMRNRTHGGYKVLLDELWEYCEQFNADMVILWEHMSCKALDGMHGLFEERAREHGIHLVWVTHDLFDPRVISRQGVRQQVNDYMRTVMQEEPVDPSLEILKDEKSW